MTTYMVQPQDLYEGRWHELGLPLAVDADSPAAAVARTARPGLVDGVTYRLQVMRDGRPVACTGPAVTPTRATLLVL